ncbi:MAG: hypothetical protein QM778_14715 [Myxococcales bacterium]
MTIQKGALMIDRRNLTMLVTLLSRLQTVVNAARASSSSLLAFVHAGALQSGTPGRVGGFSLGGNMLIAITCQRHQCGVAWF